MRLLAQDQATAALELRDKAFEAAPATTGKINDQPFEWIADADSRFGPMVEAIIDGKYYWVPFFRIASLTTAPPEDLRDLVWTATQFVWANGGEAPGFIPTRYPGTEKATDNSLRLARKTEWIDQGNDLFFRCWPAYVRHRPSRNRAHGSAPDRTNTGLMLFRLYG